MTNKTYGSDQVNLMADPKNWDLWDAPKNPELLYQFFSEFTCKCPRSGYPDFSKVHLITIPNKKVLELKCLKLWLNSYRAIGISHENATQEIADILFNVLKLNYIFVFMEYTPRGNLTTFPMTERTDDYETPFQNEIMMIKQKIINKAI